MPTFEDDLRHAREARHRTLEQIQQETRIPLHVLQRFESGDLADDPTFNRVYLVAFMRSYARAVGLPQADVVAAYDRARAGIYGGELHPDYDGPPPAPLPAEMPPVPEPSVGSAAGTTPEPPRVVATSAATPKASTAKASGSKAATPEAAAPGAGAPASARPAATSAGATAAETPVETPAPPTSPVEALRAAPVVTAPVVTAAAPVTAMRVARPAVSGARRSYDKNWGAILSLFAVVVVGIAVAIYFLFFNEPDAAAPDDLADAPGVAAQIDSAGVGAGAASGGRQLQIPIEVRVTAQNNGLQSFRVSEDAGGRRAYWFAAGKSKTFKADSALVFSGEGSTAGFADAVLEWQGLRWTPADGQTVSITAATGQRMLDSLSAAFTPVPAAAAPAP